MFLSARFRFLLPYVSTILLRARKSTLIHLLECTPALITLDISIPSFQTILAIAHHNANAQKLVPSLEICNIYVEDIAYDWSGKSASLRILASLRCEKNLKFQKIKHLGIHFALNERDRSKPYALCSPQSRLEGWKLDSDTVKIFQNLALDLFNELPEINPSASYPSRVILDPQSARRVIKILFSLDCMPIAYENYVHNIIRWSYGSLIIELFFILNTNHYRPPGFIAP